MAFSRSFRSPVRKYLSFRPRSRWFNILGKSDELESVSETASLLLFMASSRNFRSPVQEYSLLKLEPMSLSRPGKSGEFLLAMGAAC